MTLIIREIMIKLDVLQSSFDNAALPDTADETTQSQFDKIVTYIEQEKMSQATQMIENIFAKGQLDIRLIVYYLYAHFFNHGLKSFLEIFPMIVSIVNDKREMLRPQNRKDKQIQNSLNWLISNAI